MDGGEPAEAQRLEAGIPDLERLAAQIGPERWRELRGLAEQTAWEEVVERDHGTRETTAGQG